MKRMLTRKPFGTIMRGITILEVMLAIAVSALVLIGALAFYVIAKQNANAGKVVNDMMAIVAGASQFATNGNTFVASPGDVISTNLTPTYFPANYKSPFGAVYTATYASGVLTISVGGLTSATTGNCTAIASQVGPGVTAGGGSTACTFAYTL